MNSGQFFVEEVSKVFALGYFLKENHQNQLLEEELSIAKKSCFKRNYVVDRLERMCTFLRGIVDDELSSGFIFNTFVT